MRVPRRALLATLVLFAFGMPAVAAREPVADVILANARDSLADAYARKGDLAAARREYRHALAMLERSDAAPSARSAAFLKANIRRQLERLRRYPIYEPLTGLYRTGDGRAGRIVAACA